jgi:hypothetical protein
MCFVSIVYVSLWVMRSEAQLTLKPLSTRIPGEKAAGKESSYLFREVAFPRQRRRYLSNKGLVVPLRYGLPYLWGKIRASSMSARAFWSEANNFSRSVTEIMPW